MEVAILVVISLFVTRWFNSYSDMFSVTGILFIIIKFFIFFFIAKWADQFIFRKSKANIILSIIETLFLILGKYMVLYEETKLTVSALISAPFLFLYLYMVNNAMFNYTSAKNAEEKSRHYFSGFYKITNDIVYRMIVLVLVWSLYLFLFYPGVIHADTLLAMKPDIITTLHYSPIYTEIVGVIFMGFTGGITEFTILINTLIHLIIFAFCLSKTLDVLNIKDETATVITIIFALFPLFGMQAIQISKDTIFCGCFVLFLAYMYKLLKNNGNVNGLLLTGAICSLLRNNFVYVLIVAIVISLFMCRNKKMIVSFTLICCIFFGYTSALKAVGFTSDGLKESLSIPLQQMGRAYFYGKATESEKKYFEEITGPLALYDCVPNISDYLKTAMDYQRIARDPNEFMYFYKSIGKNNLKLYFDAYIAQNYYLFYPESLINTYSNEKNEQIIKAAKEDGYDIDERKVYSNDIVEILDTGLEVFENSSKSAAGLKYVEIINHKNTLQIPVIGWMFSVGLMLWICLTSFFKSIYTKDFNVSFVLLTVIIYYGSISMGPCISYRYSLPLFIIAPVCVKYIFTNTKNITICEKN